MLRKSVFASLMTMLAFASQSVAASKLPDFTDLVEKSAPAVVNISTTKVARARQPNQSFGFPNQQIPEIFRHFFQDQMPNSPDQQPKQPAPPVDVPHSSGSGFLISADGYLLTNHHVVDDADEIIVRLNDRRELTAEVIGSDERSDIALLKVDGTDLPYLTLANSDDLEVGEWVLAIGSPFGFDYSVTAGIVSAKGRSLRSEVYVPFIQTDVAINPGNSGGPLFNLDGEVVGINSQIYTRSGGFIGLSFAIPSNTAKHISDQLRDDGQVSRGWLGVHIQEVSKELAESFNMDKPVGALIADVVADSPAEGAGLQAGDVITHVNGSEIDKSSHVVHHVVAIPPGDTAKLFIVRDGEEQVIEVTIGSLKEAEAAAKKQAKTKDVYVERLGIRVLPLDEDVASEWRLTYGVVISDIDDKLPKGMDANLDLREGDVIVNLANRRIFEPEQLVDLAEQLPEDRSISIRIVRDGRSRYQAFRLHEN